MARLSQPHTLKVHLDGYRTTIELDGVPLPNVTEFRVRHAAGTDTVDVTFEHLVVEIDGVVYDDEIQWRKRKIAELGS